MKKSSGQQAQAGAQQGRHRRSTAKFTARDLPLWKAQAERNVKRADGAEVNKRRAR